MEANQPFLKLESTSFSGLSHPLLRIQCWNFRAIYRGQEPQPIPPARLHRLAELIPWSRHLCSLKIPSRDRLFLTRNRFSGIDACGPQKFKKFGPRSQKPTCQNCWILFHTILAKNALFSLSSHIKKAFLTLYIWLQKQQRQTMWITTERHLLLQNS